MTAALTDDFVPVIDISPWREGTEEGRAAVVEAVGRACRDVGFYVITGHGIDQDFAGRVEALAREFFDQPMEDKMKLHVGDRPGGVGYAALGDVSLGRTRGEVGPHDLNESFQLCRPIRDDSDYFKTDVAKSLMPENKWPEALPEMEEAFTEYYRQMGDLARDLLRISAMALNLPETWFDSSIDRHVSRMNLRLYPEQTEAPEPGQLRAAAHTDYGTVTILRPGDTEGGLEVADADGTWHPVPAIEDAFVINQGDLMARWTNDTWLSTLHRVANPATGPGRRRLSVIFFHHPNYDATVECLPTCVKPGETPRYPPIKVADYYTMKRTQQRTEKKPAA